MTLRRGSAVLAAVLVLLPLSGGVRLASAKLIGQIHLPNKIVAAASWCLSPGSIAIVCACVAVLALTASRHRQ